MDSEFEAYFRARLGSIVSPAGPSAERQAVARVVSMLPLTWRSDARFFLAKNIHLMIIRPLSWRDRQEHDLFRLDSDEWSLIEADVRAIVKAAESAAIARDRGYVSATSVAIALGELAPNLATTSLQIWGPK